MPLTGEAKRSYQRKWVARRRAMWFAGKSCVICGSRDSLELDHIDPTQKVTNRIWSWSEARRQAELDKCQVLCHDCHRGKSNGPDGDISRRLTKVRDFCSKGHNLKLVGWYNWSGYSKRCRYCIYLRDAKRRGYVTIKTESEFALQSG